MWRKNLFTKMKPLFTIFSLVIYISSVKCQSSCTTPNGLKGECKSVYQCQPLFSILNNPSRTSEEVNLLKKSQCGYQGSTPQVCCPTPCYTPEGQPGTCISVYSCKSLVSRLTPPVSAETSAYVQRSRCEGPDKYSVCCSSNSPVQNNPVQTRPVQSNPTSPIVCSLSAAPPNPTSRCCGVESEGGDRIIGGNDTAVDQYPWLTVIEYKRDDSQDITVQCGGALISGKYVLTAGHCIIGTVLKYGSPAFVRLGEFNTENEGPDCASTAGGGRDCTKGTVTIAVERSIPHPQYDPSGTNSRWNDIGLLRLSQIAPFTEFIRPICLPTADNTLKPPINFTLYVAGWGAVSESQPRSATKQHVALPFKSLQSCEPYYKVSNRRPALWKGQLCAGGEKGKDSCRGDSGGPLMVQNDDNNKTWEAIGIVSFGPRVCGTEDIPGVYTNVIEYVPWIRSQIEP